MSESEINLGAIAPEARPDRPDGFRSRATRLGPLLGAERLGATLYELDAGQSVCPYHYEYGVEEWLIVLAGSPVLRSPGGEERLAAGDVVCFPEGPGGAHRVSNVDPAPARILLLSAGDEPSVSVYPDSGKIGVWPPGKIFRESDAVPYWLGEA